MKRFYKDATVTPEGGVSLDGRSVRTPMGAMLTLPNAQLAEAVAEEWQRQPEDVDPRSMPLTGLSNAAIDKVAADHAGFASGLAAYAEGDLLCYRADDQPDLAARQEAVWDPILDWARGRYDVSFTLVAGIMHQPQPPETVRRLKEAVFARDAFVLAALSPMVTISGSLIIPLAIEEGVLDAMAGFDAAHLDELWQAELWGEDALAVQPREARRVDFMAGVRMLELLRALSSPGA